MHAMTSEMSRPRDELHSGTSLEHTQTTPGPAHALNISTPEEGCYNGAVHMMLLPVDPTDRI